MSSPAGSSSAPACVALKPCTSCTINGTKNMVPNNPMPSTKDNSEPHENANDRYTLTFNKGFGYTQLQYRKAAPQHTPNAIRPIVDRLSHPICWPLVST